MAIQNDPYNKLANLSDDEILRRRTAEFDNELQADPELAEGPAGGARMGLFALAFVAILGVVFYGLNHQSTAPTSTAQTTTTSPITGPVTTAPRAPAGQTTGSAMTPTQPSTVQPTPPAVVTAPSSLPDPAGATSRPAGAPASN